MVKYIVAIICLLNTGCNNHLEFDLNISKKGVTLEKKTAGLYIQVDDCKKSENLDKALANDIIKITKKDCYITGDGIKVEYQVPLTVSDSWLNVDSISIISNKNTFSTIKIPYKTIKLFKNRVNYYLANYPLGNEYPIVNFNITLKGDKNLTLNANSIYHDGTPIAHGEITLKEGETSSITLSKIAIEQLFNTGKVTIFLDKK